jgi:sensor c-di-GMP phosphodiesterase-like protein
MRTLFQRTMVTLGSTIALGLTGLLGGYLLGHAIALRQAYWRLDQYASRIMNEADSATAESRSVLSKMNVSPYPYCSEAEVVYFRQLIFSSHYLKAAGRMHEGRIGCSTTFGRLPGPQAAFQPTVSRHDGTLVYRNLPQFQVNDEAVIAVQQGESFIVYNPYNFNAFTIFPMHYVVTAIDPAGPQAGQLVSDTAASAQSASPKTSGKARIGENLYFTHCSREFGTCLTAYTTVPDAIKNSRAYCVVSMFLGGVFGSVFGLICPLLYSRNKSLEHQLLRAVRSDSLSVVYQPIVDLATGKVMEAEALVRWTDEYENPVSPEVFIKVAEERGFVGEITNLVIRRVLRDLGSTMRARPDFRVNVNIAASDLADPDFLTMVQQALDDAEVTPRNLGIEITESYTARQQAAKDTILRLRRNGHFVHIDDFGTGYSSLAYLHDLSVDAIKIDKAFTQAIGTDAVTVTILPQILTMASTLNLHVVVEGIETQAQADYFAASDRSIRAQGWLFGRPVPGRLFLQMLDDEEDRATAGVPIAELADPSVVVVC